MTRRKKILLIAGASLGGALVILLVTAILVLRSAWFANYVREKIVATVEESTGGVAELGSFQFDWSGLTVRIRNFVLHGTEPKTAAPLARVELLELHLRLFSGIAHAIDLAYLGVQKPEVNLIVFPDGTTNVPQPKVQQRPSDNNGLETVVNLKIGRFDLTDGLLQHAQQKTAFSGRGENLRALLSYDPLKPGYTGNLSIDPLLLTSGSLPPVRVHVNMPVSLEKDAIHIDHAMLSTDRSKILVSAAMQRLNSPVIDGHLQADISLPEIARSLDLGIDPNAKGAPQNLSADLIVHADDKTQALQIQTAHVALGQTNLEAAGNLREVNNPAGALQFNGNLALDELSKLLKVASPQVSGVVALHGNARLDSQNNYQVNGAMNGRGISIRDGSTHLADVGIYAPFHADPYLISFDGIKLDSLGGSLAAKVFLENMRQLSVEGALRNFSLPVMAAVATGKHLGYDGTVNGSLVARGDLKAKGTTGYTAEARLAISPGGSGVPVSGQVNASYSGARNSVDLGQSYLLLPHSRLDLSGAVNKRLDANLTSHDLNDFLPAINFGAKAPTTSLPLALRGGTASLQGQVTGNLSAPQINAHLSATKFSIEQEPLDTLALDLAASSSQASIQNGSIARDSMRANFDGVIGLHNWSPEPASPLTANVSLRNASLPDLLRVASEGSIPATGEAAADIHINGSYGNPLGSANVQVLNGSAYEQPFSRFAAQVNLSDRLITLSSLELVSDAGAVSANGTFHHLRASFSVGDGQLHVATSSPVQLAKIKKLQEQSPGAAGTVQLTADAALSVRTINDKYTLDVSSVNGNLSAQGLRVQNQDAGSLTFAASTINRTIRYQLTSDFAGSSINVNGQTALASDYPTTADASIKNLPIAKASSIAGQSDIPASGTLSADGRLSGTTKNPTGNLTFALLNANVYQEPIDRLAGSMSYSGTQANILSLALDTPAGSVTLSGSYTHAENNLNDGSLKLKVNTTDIQLAKIEHIREQQPALTGTLHMAADLSANVRESQGQRTVMISSLNADAATNALKMNRRDLGGASLSAKTTGSNLDFQVDSDIAQSKIHGSGRAQLTGDYPLQGKLSFANIKYSNIAPFVSEEPVVRPSFDALVEGEASVSGPVMDAGALDGRLQLNTLQMQTQPSASPTGGAPRRQVTVRNTAPIVLSLNHSLVNIQQFHLQGPSTDVNASGTVNLKDQSTPMNLAVDAFLDLALIQDVNRDFYSHGTVAIKAAIHGSFSQPLLNGRVALKDANINYATSPNGLSNGNGVILLSGTGATIQSLTGNTGGGKISVTGFAGLTGQALTYNLKSTAQNVRVRYSGVSVTSNATIALIGNSNRSVVSGNVSVQDLSYNTSSDAGSLLSSFASTPPSSPSAPSAFLTGMRLNIHILTAPDLRVTTTYANRLAIEANLTVRGTAATPGLLGRVVITDGELVFFGNTYTVNTGTINFYNASSIEPVLNISLETLAQGVDVTLGVAGPMENLKLTYSSDPPLSFEQIIQLLATNTTPNDPNIVANQPASPQQSFTQMGESAILGQAIANPLASRVQRVFGLSQFKIDPSVAGNNGQPSARVTLQQKIFNNVTFTYITDVTQTNSEIVRVEWDLTPKFSAVGLRDFNGNVSVEFFYKFKVR